jgi:hypothetical protein
MIRDVLPKRGLVTPATSSGDGALPIRPMGRATGMSSSSSFAQGSSTATTALTQQALRQQARAQSMAVGSRGATASASALPLSSAGSLPLSSAPLSSLPLASGLDGLGGGGTFEDQVFAIMCQVTEDFQNQIEQRLQNLQNEATDAEGTAQAGGQDPGAESRNIEFETIKYDMQKLSEMQQCMSNVLDSMNDLAQNAIRNIKVS